jgi:hypothetical protein
VLRDHKYLIYGGGLFAGVAVATPILPSDAVFCVDNRVMCAPLPVQMGDLPSEDGPQPIHTLNPLLVAGSTATLTPNGADLARSFRPLPRWRQLI